MTTLVINKNYDDDDDDDDDLYVCCKQLLTLAMHGVEHSCSEIFEEFGSQGAWLYYVTLLTFSRWR